MAGAIAGRGDPSLRSARPSRLVAAERSGVRFELGRAVSLDQLLARRPDSVILATGAQMIRPDWLPEAIHSEGWVVDLRTAMTEVLQHNGLQSGAIDPGDTAVICDTDHTEAVYAAAEALRARFARTVIVTPRDTIATDVPMVNRQGIIRRLAEQRRIEIVTTVEPVWNDTIAEGKLGLMNIYNEDLDHDRRPGAADLCQSAGGKRRVARTVARGGHPGDPHRRRPRPSRDAFCHGERARSGPFGFRATRA